MYQTLFSYLNWANPKNIANSEEEAFYDRNATLFNVALTKYNDNTSLFGIIRADIILAGLVTKSRIDHHIKVYDKVFLQDGKAIQPFFRDRPYFVDQGQRIYIPTYSRNINERYTDHLSTLKEFPYSALVMDPTSSLVDPFETYGASLFDSSFTRLVKLSVTDGKSTVFYHPEFHTIFVVDGDGGLEEEIPLFDENIKNPIYADLYNRLETLMKAYFANDRDCFLADLKDFGLISPVLYKELVHVVDKNIRRKRKVLSK